MAKFYLTPLAEADLEGIEERIASERPEAARKMIAAIKATCQQLTEFPRLGQLQTAIAPDCRMITVRRYVIYYRYSQQRDQIQIFRIVDGARDTQRLDFGIE